MRTLKIFKMVLVLLFITALPAHAGWVETSEEGVSYYGKGVFKQVPSPEQGGPDSIMDFKKGIVTLVDHGSQTYTTFNFDQYCQIIKKMYAGMPPDMLAQVKQMNAARPKPNVSVKKLGKGEAVAGYGTTRYQVMNNGQPERTVWIAEDARFSKYNSEYWAQMTDSMKKMRKCDDLGMSSDAVDTSPAYLEMWKRGWIMKEEVLEEDPMGGESPLVEELVEENLPADTFEVPQGYRKVPFEQFDFGN